MGIEYDLENFEFAINEYVYEFPTLINFWGENVSGYSIQPAAMPAGLSFNSSSGVISGTPTSAFSTQIYTITASTVLGFDLTTEISITVEDDGAPVCGNQLERYKRGRFRTWSPSLQQGAGPASPSLPPCSYALTPASLSIEELLCSGLRDGRDATVALEIHQRRAR